MLVEDDANFGMVLSDYLKINGYNVDLAPNGKLGYNLMQQREYDLCILDVMMPEMDGFTLAGEIQRKKPDLSFFFLTARSLKKDIVEGYRLGARDYLSKPFDPEILLLKINAILNWGEEKAVVFRNKYDFLNYSLDTELRVLQSGEQEWSLSPRECQVLAFLLEHRGELVKRDDVLDAIWHENNYFTARSMDVYINKLRKLFVNDNRIELRNLRGKGFILVLKEYQS